MKLFMLGVTHRKGISDSGKGRPYEICNINTIRSVVSNQGEHNNFTAAGYRESEVALDPSGLNDFLGLHYPAEYDVITETVHGQRGLEIMVTGLKK